MNQVASRKALATTPALRATSAASALCTMPDQASASAEIRRVFKPVRPHASLEHVRSDDLKLPRWQEQLTGSPTSSTIV
jgi:hypothetical protein